MKNPERLYVSMNSVKIINQKTHLSQPVSLITMRENGNLKQLAMAIAEDCKLLSTCTLKNKINDYGKTRQRQVSTK